MGNHESNLYLLYGWWFSRRSNRWESCAQQSSGLPVLHEQQLITGKTSCGLRDFSCSAFWSCRSMPINPFFLDGFYKLPNKLGFGSSMDLSLGQSTPGPRFLKKSNCSSRYSGLLNRACWCFPDTSDRRKSWHGCRDRATDLFRDSFTLSHGSESAEALGFPLLQFCISNISSTVPFEPRCCG